MEIGKSPTRAYQPGVRSEDRHRVVPVQSAVGGVGICSIKPDAVLELSASLRCALTLMESFTSWAGAHKVDRRNRAFSKVAVRPIRASSPTVLAASWR